MTAVIGAPVGTYFTLRIYKKLTTNPAIVWSNFYELVSNAVITANNVVDLVTNFVNYEKVIHLPSVEFDRAVLSTWIEDGQPYDPQSFITEPIAGQVGTRTAAGDPEPLHVVFFVRRRTAYGQNGKIFYRRSLSEGDVIAPSGTPALLNGAGIITDLETAKVNIADYMNGGEAFGLVMKSLLLLNREVDNLVAAGVRIVQYNNRYYDVP